MTTKVETNIKPRLILHPIVSFSRVGIWRLQIIFQGNSEKKMSTMTVEAVALVLEGLHGSQASRNWEVKTNHIGDKKLV